MGLKVECGYLGPFQFFKIINQLKHSITLKASNTFLRYVNEGLQSTKKIKLYNS